ncbi:MAG: DUF4465 domain-containing protein [Muribaculaceae bacterium]|nr:DUF4465 domain-containing protein [Muribaculaceae bacterium]
MSVKHTILAILAATFALSSCNNSKDDSKPKYTWIPSFSDFNQQGYWAKCYDTTVGSIDADGFRFSHEAEGFEYDGVSYYNWFGFCPSESTDNADYSNANWTEHQWTSVTGSGFPGLSPQYLVGCWRTDGGESSCRISTIDGTPITLLSMSVTNTSWGYYAMKQGSAFSKAFGPDDYCLLNIKGYCKGKVTGETSVYLAKGTDILNQWAIVNTTALGSVDTVVFTMDSSDTSEYGMNNPAYFCLGNLFYSL